ncbi:MAG: hypothetical protein IPK97_01300 [Ahniella sp.]|nr:hypothetical protein [Ahniella sp.]
MSTSNWRLSVLGPIDSGNPAGQKLVNGGQGFLVTSLALAALLLVSGRATGCIWDLEGTWKSDREASINFAEQRGRLKPEQFELLSQMWGNMTVTYDTNTSHFVWPDIEVSVAGKKQRFAGSEELSAYSVVACNSEVIVVTVDLKANEEPAVLTMHFEEYDGFWVYLAKFNVREYFSRVR